MFLSDQHAIQGNAEVGCAILKKEHTKVSNTIYYETKS